MEAIVADEELVPEGEPEALDAPVEEGVETVETPEADPLAELATEMGWTPKDQFKGDPEAWKDARTYIRHGKDIQTNLSRELRAVKDTVENISRTSAAVAQHSLERQKQELTAKFNHAVEEGDNQAAFNISSQINKLDTVNIPPPPPPSAATDFAAKNQWFNSDPMATRLALETAQTYADMGKPAHEQLAAAEREVRRQYPDLFPKPRTQPAVTAPTTRAATRSNTAKGFHDMPPQAQQVAKDMVERGVIPSTDLYVTNYFAGGKQ